MDPTKNKPRAESAVALQKVGWDDPCNEWSRPERHSGSAPPKKTTEALDQRAIERLRDSLGIVELKEEIEQLKRLAATGSFVTYLHSLGIADLEVVQRIPVTVERDGDEYIANFFDANVSTGGCTAQEAVSNLQSLLADVFEMHEDVRGPLNAAMESQRNVLNEFICRTSRKT